MGDADPSELPSQPPVTIKTSTKPAGWRLVNFTRATVQHRSDPQRPKHHNEPTQGWSAVQHDFERRLSRFGIKISEANSDSASITSSKAIVHTRGGAHAIMDGYDRNAARRDIVPLVSRPEDFPPLEAPGMAAFTNNKQETKLEAVERQLRQARTEAQVWKEKCEAQERHLRESYNETMEWRMKYEDLYSAIIQDRQVRPQDAPVNREGTKSLG